MLRHPRTETPGPPQLRRRKSDRRPRPTTCPTTDRAAWLPQKPMDLAGAVPVRPCARWRACTGCPTPPLHMFACGAPTMRELAWSKTVVQAHGAYPGERDRTTLILLRAMVHRPTLLAVVVVYHEHEAWTHVDPRRRPFANTFRQWPNLCRRCGWRSLFYASWSR